MPVTEFLKNVTADEIKVASDESDKAADARLGHPMAAEEFHARMASRLREEFPGLSERIAQFVEEMDKVEDNMPFLMGMYVGATMMAHDITIAAEVYDAKRMLGEA